MGTTSPRGRQRRLTIAASVVLAAGLIGTPLGLSVRQARIAALKAADL